jgi:hypothetical protein
MKWQRTYNVPFAAMAEGTFKRLGGELPLYCQRKRG